MILSAQSIRAIRPVEPLYERQEVHIDGYVFTRGLGPSGYDVSLAEAMTLEPGHTFLGSTVEHFNMPLDCMAIVHDKSSLARRGLAVQNTVIEPGWRGYLTLELTFVPLWGGPIALLLRAGTPIAQVVFHRLDEPTQLPYAGKYQDQAPGPQPAQ